MSWAVCGLHTPLAGFCPEYAVKQYRKPLFCKLAHKAVEDLDECPKRVKAKKGPEPKEAA